MSGYERRRRTIVHFSTNRMVLHLRAWNLNEMGYHVLITESGFEAIKLASRDRVDAVVLDLDRNHDEVALVATEIKRCRPQVPTIMLVEGTAPPHPAHELADALVPKRDDVEMLAATLDSLFATGGREPAKSQPRYRRLPG